MRPIKTSLPIAGFWDTRQGGRPENQDSCGFIDTEKGLIVVVCDGMGGGPAGQLASTIAVKRIVEYLVRTNSNEANTELMAHAVDYAHQGILLEVQKNPAVKGMGTTVAALLINDQSAILAHVGDSRIYQFRRGKKIYRTDDHSFVGELVRKGSLTEEQARLSSQSNIITRALGGNADHQADVVERPYEKGDRFMLCSDGIWGALPEPELIKKIAKTPSLSGTVDSIVLEVDELGRANGNHHDNLTIALLETKQDSILKEKMSRRTFRMLMTIAVICAISIIANLIMAGKLLSPKESDRKIKELQEILALKDKKIDSLNTVVSKLNGDKIIANAEASAAKVGQEAAEKAQAKAEAAAEKATEAANKAGVSELQAKTSEANVRKLVEQVIEILTKARDKREGTDRKQLRERAKRLLEELAKKDPTHKSIYSGVVLELKKPVAERNPNASKGQYDALIKELERIK